MIRSAIHLKSFLKLGPGTLAHPGLPRVKPVPVWRPCACPSQGRMDRMENFRGWDSQAWTPYSNQTISEVQSAKKWRSKSSFLVYPKGQGDATAMTMEIPWPHGPTGMIPRYDEQSSDRQKVLDSSFQYSHHPFATAISNYGFADEQQIQCKRSGCTV